MSSIKTKLFGKCQDNWPTFNSVDAIRNHMRQFEEGTDLEITIEKFRIRRTSGKNGEKTNFNGYYHGVIMKMVMEAMGEMGDIGYQYCHGLIQHGVGNYKLGPNGEKIVLGTKWMSGGEFAEFCSKARIWASKELNLYLPEPHEVVY